MTVDEFIAQWHDGSDTIEVHTSGSTGSPKVMLVEKSRMLASARATCDFLGLRPGDTALLCMSVDYIAGKMMVVRSIERNLHLVTVEPTSHPLAEIAEKVDEMGQKLVFSAMVPLQVYSSLQEPSEREMLKKIQHIIIGGGPLDPSLEQELRHFDNAIWHSYGMTETLSHIALRRVSGDSASAWFTPMPGISLTVNEDQCLVIDAPHLCPERLVTHDVVEMEAGSQLFKVLGRIDNVINTGSVKVHIEEIEKTLSPHMTCPFLITKCSDEKFGEKVVMLLQGSDDDVRTAQVICEQYLPKYSRPKHILTVEALPLTPTGKPARQKAADLVSQALRSE
jgi:O-succinylbenzoic acid--CoA ligase